MGSPYYVPMYAMKVKKPDLDLTPMAEGFDALRQRRLQDEVGQMMSGNDLKGASRAAYRGGDVRTGNDLRRMQHTEEDRARVAGDRQTAAADRETKAKAAADEKARSYVSNMMSTLDPNSETFADDWKHHVGRLRAAGYNVGPEYDDPRTGYQMVLGEVSSFKDRSTVENQRRDDDLRRQELDIRRQEVDSKGLSRNRNDALRAIKLMRDSTTPEQWQENSGVINAVFGRPVAFNERNVVLAQAESAASSGDEFEPSDRDRALGITRDDKMRDARNAEFKKTYGEPKRGYVWQRDESGQVVQVPVARNLNPLSKIFGESVNPVQAIDTLVKSTQRGGNIDQLRAFYRVVDDKGDRITATGALLHRMAEDGLEGFLRSYRSLSPDARRVMFQGASREFGASLDRLARVGGRLEAYASTARDGYTMDLSRLARPGNIVFGLLGYLNIPVAIQGAVGAEAASRLMASKRFGQWLRGAANVIDRGPQSTEWKRHVYRLASAGVTGP